jgi:signal transduction histidine kinase
MAIAVLEVTRGNLAERIHFLKPRSYTIGRARHNDLSLIEPSISKVHAHLEYTDGRFYIEDRGSLHGVYVNAVKTQRAELFSDALVQLGNVTLRFSPVSKDGSSTDRIAEYPWIEQQQLLLSLVQTLNSTLVLSQVLDQVLDAVMSITRAERGFLLLSEAPELDGGQEPIAGLYVRLGRRRDGAAAEPVGLSTSVVRRAIESGGTVATGNAVADPSLAGAPSVILMDLRTIVCIPLSSPRGELETGDSPRPLGAIYADNHETSAPFSPDSLKTAEALTRHASLAIENAQLFEREQRTIRELRLAQDQLLQSEKLAALGKMAAGIAHELNTPLTYIMGNLELLRGDPLTPHQQEMVASATRGTERISSLVTNLLALSRPSDEEPYRLDVGRVLEHALEMCHYQLIKAGVRLERQLDESLPPVLGLASQLEIAVINLVVNAIQATPFGGTVTVSADAKGGEVRISVSDTGAGIPEDLQASIFEPFFTTKREGQGTGLGLSTVQMVVSRHQGRLDFKSVVGSGTTFEIRLPVAEGT